MTSAADAFKKIADTRATFVSRGDGSGTETKELGYWKKRGITPDRPGTSSPARAWAPRSRSRRRRRATR